MEEKLDLVLAQLKSLSDEVNRLNTEVSTLNTGQKIMFAKQQNMTKGPYEPLEKVLNQEGALPPIYPPSYSSLLVAGNERNAAGWKAKQSLALIRFYDPEYESDEEAPTTSRRRRVKLASCLGITPSQLNLGYEVHLWK
ncbi:hypothetical protein QOT17_004110 [Balamuthia mandrillaris]